MKLTEYAHGGGCGCKISPSLLKKILGDVPPIISPDLLVGYSDSDDAAVYRLSEEIAIVATTDFFTPIVDDPHDFGRIAATNAFSDVYAMGAKPLFALGIVGMPIDKLPAATISLILEGGRSVCEALHVPLAGGHSIDSPEPIYGLVVVGQVHPNRVKKNSNARVGDSILLSKPLGIGVLSAALKKGLLTSDEYQLMLSITTQVNVTGEKLSKLSGVNAVTDVTGFGFLGHLKEMVIGSSTHAQIELSNIPIIEASRGYSEQGIVTGASGRNWESYSDYVSLGQDVDASVRNLLTDPQTSGGLLVSCEAGITDEVIDLFKGDGFFDVSVVGSMTDSSVGITLL
jgi:selenide,water dikinase